MNLKTVKLFREKKTLFYTIRIFKFLNPIKKVSQQETNMREKQTYQTVPIILTIRSILLSRIIVRRSNECKQ